MQVGRIVQANPVEGEHYYLRVLLNNVAGSTSFEDLRTVNGEMLPTFREAAQKRGFIEGDNGWDDALTEATLYSMPSSLKMLFVTDGELNFTSSAKASNTNSPNIMATFVSFDVLVRSFSSNISKPSP